MVTQVSARSPTNDNRIPDTCLSFIPPVNASRIRVQRIHSTVLANRVNTPAHHRGLAESNCAIRRTERPLQPQAAYFAAIQPSRRGRLETRVLVVRAPSIPSRVRSRGLLVSRPKSGHLKRTGRRIFTQKMRHRRPFAAISSLPCARIAPLSRARENMLPTHLRQIVPARSMHLAIGRMTPNTMGLENTGALLPSTKRGNRNGENNSTKHGHFCLRYPGMPCCTAHPRQGNNSVPCIVFGSYDAGREHGKETSIPATGSASMPAAPVKPADAK